MNDRNPNYIKMVDKYDVREYIYNQIGEKYLVPLIGVWEKVDDIDFSILPSKFVLKCTHDSWSTFICRDKNKFDTESIKIRISKALKRNFYYYGRECPKKLKPRVICEEYMTDGEAEGLKDYKVMCLKFILDVLQIRHI